MSRQMLADIVFVIQSKSGVNQGAELDRMYVVELYHLTFPNRGCLG